MGFDFRKNYFIKRFGKTAFDIVCHVAVASNFTPELFHIIRINFFPGEKYRDHEINALLSEFCREYYDSYYEIEENIKGELLTILKKQYGVKRICEVASLILLYGEKYPNWTKNNRLFTSQKIQALALVDPQAALRWLEVSYCEAQSQWFRITKDRVDELIKLVYQD